MTRMIAIASGKGGVGKTWLAVTLGHALARLGQRVLLFDGDFGLANVDVQLGLGPGPDLAMVLAGRCTLARTVRRIDSTGFDLIAGRSGSGIAASLDLPVIASLLTELCMLAGRYDAILLDLPAGVDQGVQLCLAQMTDRLVITSDEPTALTDAYALIKITSRDGSASPPAIVVNFAPSLQAGRQTHDGLSQVCRRFLGFEPSFAGAVRKDQRVVESIRHQTPLLTRSPDCPAARDVMVLAQTLVRPAGAA